MDDTKQEVTLNEEQLMGLIQESENTGDKIFLFEPIEFDDIEDKILKYPTFTDGCVAGSFYAGMYSTLVNVGIDVESAIAIVMNEQATRHNKDIAEINANASIEVAKHGSRQVEDTKL